MSQLYELFCEGLRSRPVGDGFSSTLVVTSTPLEDDEAEAEPQQEPGNEFVINNNAPRNMSMEGQVGSAETETPPVQAVPVVPNQVCSANQAHTDNQGPILPDDALDERESSSHHEIRKRKVSSVDFVDRIIAIKRRDEALCPKRKAVPSSNEKSPPEKEQVIDSSETDFEGAEEYFEKNPSHRPAGHSRASSSKEKSDDESNMVLTMPLILDSNSSNSSIVDVENTSQLGTEYLSAARCRIYHKLTEHEGRLNQRDSLLQKTPMESGSKICENQVVNNPISSILKGVVAHVEVRSGHDNRSMGVRTQLQALGATVVRKLGKEVTHVVFNEGYPSTLRRAQNQGCHLVSVLWIEESKNLGCKAPESEHPPLNLHLYNNPHVRSKYRKLKSFQPDFEEGESEERLNQYIKRCRRRVQRVSPQTNNSGSSTKENSESDAENTTSDGKLHGAKLPDGVVLKPLSIVLNKVVIADPAAPSPTPSEKRKRRLMPLEGPAGAALDSVPPQDYNPTDLLRPECPYNKPSSSKQKPPSKSAGAVAAAPQIQNRPRRSSCFIRARHGLMGSQYRQKKVKPQMRTMVCTFMHRRDIDVVAAVLKQLGGWILEPTVSHKTTHVVCGDEKRTINLLRGIAYGCWILHQEWVMRSLEVGYWLDEEPFELTMFPAIQQCRIARETLGVQPNLFSTVGGIYIAKETIPPRQDIQELLELCGARIVKAARQAKLIIGQYQRRASHTDVAHVNEQWILDSIQENMLQSYRYYRVD